MTPDPILTLAAIIATGILAWGRYRNPPLPPVDIGPANGEPLEKL